MAGAVREWALGVTTGFGGGSCTSTLATSPQRCRCAPPPASPPRLGRSALINIALAHELAVAGTEQHAVAAEVGIGRTTLYDRPRRYDISS